MGYVVFLTKYFYFDFIKLGYNNKYLFYSVCEPVGKSTHNQRIERLWRDVFAGCLSLFYDLFYDLERQNILHPDNEGHLWCLHYVFLPIINKHLTNWKNAWVYHPMRTERNKSPMQLWIRGLQEAWGSQSLEDEVFQVPYEANTPFYRYGSYIELIRFKDYYRMPRRHKHISFVSLSTFRDVFS